MVKTANGYCVAGVIDGLTAEEALALLEGTGKFEALECMALRNCPHTPVPAAVPAFIPNPNGKAA